MRSGPPRPLLSLALAVMFARSAAAAEPPPGAPAVPAVEAASAELAAAPRVPTSPGDPVQASRRNGPIEVDGLLEEPAWAAATPFDGFVQIFPDAGAAPSERTEVRILFDDRRLYFGVRCLDRDPAAIRRQLARRDSLTYSDQVQVVVDSQHDRRSAFVFTLTAGGVQHDGLLSEDDVLSSDWDAVWEGAAAVTADGWSAELVIPLAALRFPPRPEQVWGIAITRTIGRTSERVRSILRPADATNPLLHLQELRGLNGLPPVQDLELTPYLATRLRVRPRYDDVARPEPRLADPSGDLGLDLRTSVGRGLTLQGTLNPDFGQVEADQMVQNLTGYELQFPEKRPFFTQGMDLFTPVAPRGRPSPQQLFYSRRIGLDAPILGAAKLTGAVSDAVQVGLVEAFVDGAGSGLADGDPARAVRFTPEQPLHLAPERALPALAPASRNFAAAVARWHPDPTTTLGATATSTVATGRPCTAAEDALADDLRPRRCDALAGETAAIDWSLRSRDGTWFLRGQATGSRADGGPPSRTLLDGTVIRRGDLGHGAFVSAGKQGGEPWRFELGWDYESPRLELNALGFQRTQNEQLGRAKLSFVRPSGGGPFQDWLVVLGGEQRTTTDGRGLSRATTIWLGSEVQLRDFHRLGLYGYLDLPRWDVREVARSGVALRRQPTLAAEAWVLTDPSRAVRMEGDAWLGGIGPRAELPSELYWGATAKVFLRTHPRLETGLEAGLEHNAWTVRWVDDGAPDPDGVIRTRYLAALTAPALSITLRQQVVITPRLTLQGYTQLFTTSGRYGRFYLARAAAGGRIGFSDLQPIARPTADAGGPLENPDFRQGGLNVSLVLRWEYRLGSTLFLVYQRTETELGYPDGPADRSPSASLAPQRLGEGPAVDAVLVKWTYRWTG